MIIPSSCHKPIQFVVTLLEHAPTKPVLNNNQKKIVLIRVKTVRKAFFRTIVIGVRTNATGEGAGTHSKCLGWVLWWPQQKSPGLSVPRSSISHVSGLSPSSTHKLAVTPQLCTLSWDSRFPHLLCSSNHTPCTCLPPRLSSTVFAQK